MLPVVDRVVARPGSNRLSQSLPFQKVKHAVGTLDAQPSVNGGIVILITGQLLVRPLHKPVYPSDQSADQYNAHRSTRSSGP